MLLRVKRPLSGSVDGVDLTQFRPGVVYTFSAHVAGFLLAIGAAEPVDDSAEMVASHGARLFESRRQSSVPSEPWLGPERRKVKRDL
jgi:hypothetical protein